MTLRLLHTHLYAYTATLALLAAVSIWFNLPALETSQTPAQPVEEWRLPAIEKNDSKAATAIITRRRLWGAATTEIQQAPEWHVLGIVRNGAERFVLLAYEGKPVEMVKVGDSLPDGTKIVQIEKDRFFVMTPDKKKLAFGIYKNEPAK